MWAIVKSLESALSSQKEVNLLFGGRGILERARTLRHIKEKTLLRRTVFLMTHVSLRREGMSCASDRNYSLDYLPQFYYLTPGKWVRWWGLYRRSKCDGSNNTQHFYSLVPDRPCDKHYISFGLLQDSYYMLSHHLKWKRGKERLSHTAEGVEKRHWGKVRHTLS